MLHLILRNFHSSNAAFDVSLNCINFHYLSSAIVNTYYSLHNGYAWMPSTSFKFFYDCANLCPFLKGHSHEI